MLLLFYLVGSDYSSRRRSGDGGLATAVWQRRSGDGGLPMACEIKEDLAAAAWTFGWSGWPQVREGEEALCKTGAKRDGAVDGPPAVDGRDGAVQ